MTRFLAGLFVASLAYIAAYIYGPDLLNKLFTRGDTGWTDCCKQPDYRQMGGHA